MQYKEVSIDELNQLAKLHNKLAYFIQAETKDEYWNFDVLSEEKTMKFLEEFIKKSNQKIFITKDKSDVAGFIMGEIINCHLPISTVEKIGYISGAYVLPDYRKKGIMKELESLISGYFIENKLEFVEVNFLLKNVVAKNSWEKLGYEIFREQARKKL